MVNDRARIGTWGRRGQMQRPARKCVLRLLDADYCAAKLAGYQSARVEPTRALPKQNKVPKWAAGCPAPSDSAPPRRNPTFPVNTHLHQQQGKREARQGKAHPTRSQQPTVHSFCIFDIAVAADECCTSCDQIAVSAAQRDCALSPQFPCLHFPIFLLLIFSVPLYITIPSTKPTYGTSLRDEPVL